MIAVPFAVSGNEYSVFVVLDDEGIERIKSYDPAEFVPQNLGEPWKHRTLRDVLIGYATKEEIERLTNMKSSDDVRVALRHLSRGWKFRPELGDKDGPYVRVV